jgi:hypothetical protein
VSSGLTSAQAGLAALSDGTTVVCGLVAGDPAFSISSNGGASWGLSAGTVPDPAGYSNAGWICGNNGAFVYHAGSRDADVTVRICRSADGVTWAILKDLPAPGGFVFNTQARILMCQSTGLLLVVSELDATSGGVAPAIAYASGDLGLTWSKPFMFAAGGTPPPEAWAVADGRVFCTLAAKVFASDGIGRT